VNLTKKKKGEEENLTKKKKEEEEGRRSSEANQEIKRIQFEATSCQCVPFGKQITTHSSLLHIFSSVFLLSN